VQVFPTSIKDPGILYKMIDEVNPEKQPKIEAGSMLHSFDPPVLFVVASTSSPPLDRHLTQVERTYCEDVAR
jgi:hypothetical protein